MLNRIARSVLGIALLATLGFAQDAPKPQPKVKDQAEFDLFNAITKEQDPNKKLALLDQWTEKYPGTEFKVNRNLFYIQTYSAIEGQGVAPNASADAQEAAKKASNTLLEKLDAFFAPDLKPDQLSEADWQKAKVQYELQSHGTLAGIATQKKDSPTVEAEYAKILGITPDNALVSYQLGTLIAAQKKTERIPEALYHFARALSVTGPTALPADLKKKVDSYLTKQYTGYHGDTTGLAELRTAAATAAMPPAGFSIKSVTEISKEQIGSEEEFLKAHPEIATWRAIKGTLVGEGGEAYFNDKMKGAGVPVKGKVVAQVSPKELTVAVDNATPEAAAKPEVTVKLDTPLRGTVEPGTEISFEGVPTAFTKEPFMVTFEAERSKVKGLGAAAAAAPPAARRRPTKKK